MDVRIVDSKGKALHMEQATLSEVLAVVRKSLEDETITELRLEIER